MFVGRRMTRNLITVTGDTSILKVKNLLKEHNIDQVPVVDDGRLIGIISDKDIRKHSASPASTLSVHELNYLLSEMTAAEIMTKNLITVSPATYIEEAALLINEKRVNSLPVVVGDELVGIITTCDLLNVLLEFMGVGYPSSRVELMLSGDAGELERIAGIVTARDLSIISIVSNMNQDGTRTVIIRLNTDDIEDLCEDFKRMGYTTTYEYRVDK